MRKSSHYLVYSFLTLIGLLSGCIGEGSSGEIHAILRLLPDVKELGEWYMLGRPQTAKGDDLFILINGGAEIYQEYGFRSAVIASYERDQETSVNLEIYQMKDAEAAYGVYSFKRGRSPATVKIGDEGSLQDYYLNVWKGSFVITVIGFDTSEETHASLMSLARLVTAKIDTTASKPALAALLGEAVPYAGIVYLKGNLALFNQYEFSSHNIFGMHEGAAARLETKDRSIFLFHYKSDTEADSWYSKGRDALMQSDKFKDFKQGQADFSLMDGKGTLLYVTSVRNYIICCLAGDVTTAERFARDIKQRIVSTEQ